MQDCLSKSENKRNVFAESQNLESATLILSESTTVHVVHVERKLIGFSGVFCENLNMPRKLISAAVFLIRDIALRVQFAFFKLEFTKSFDKKSLQRSAWRDLCYTGKQMRAATTYIPLSIAKYNYNAFL